MVTAPQVLLRVLLHVRFHARWKKSHISPPFTLHSVLYRLPKCSTTLRNRAQKRVKALFTLRPWSCAWPGEEKFTVDMHAAMQHHHLLFYMHVGRHRPAPNINLTVRGISPLRD